MNTEIYKRSTELLDKYTTFIQSINQENLQKNITVQNLFSLKSVLSNINNVLTLLATLAIARKIIEIFNIDNKQKEDIFFNIENKKANSNGFDIQIDAPRKILVEVKCNALIHEQKLGQAQINSILEDARKLRKESLRHRKIKIETSEYLKIIGIVNSSTKFYEKVVTQIIKEVKCKENTNPERQERLKVKKHICPLTSISDLINIQDLDKIYLVGISVDDMEKELQKIKTVQK